MNTAITAPLSFWGDKFWHHKVHQRLEEDLYYFLVRLRPLDVEQVKLDLEALITTRQLGSVRVFPIFGSFDFMIRAWLHPSVADQFKTWLDAHLARTATTSRPIHTFKVESINKRWHDQNEVDANLLEGIEEEAIRAAQLGDNPDLVRRLMKGGLVLSKRRTKQIGFFMTITIDPSYNLEAGIVEAVKLYLRDNPGIINVSIYRGFGFCSVLVKGEANGFFNISPLPNQIGQMFITFGARTETFICHTPSEIVGNSSIGEQTFRAIQGKDLFVLSILPELYDDHADRKRPVEQLLLEHLHHAELHQSDKVLLHDYLLGYLNGNKREMAKTLAGYFFDVESYLRDNHKEFIARRTKDSPTGWYEKAHLSKSEIDQITLRQLLQLYALVIKETDDKEDYKDLHGGWQELASLRNDVMHSKINFLSNWEEPIKTLALNFMRIRVMIGLIQEVTGKPFEEGA